MEQTVNQRIDAFLKKKNISQNEIAMKLAVTKQTVSNWVNSTVQIPLKHIVALLTEYEYLDAKWLLTGKGAMETGGVAENLPETKKQEGAIELLKEQLAGKEKIIADLHKEIGRLEGQISRRNRKQKNP